MNYYQQKVQELINNFAQEGSSTESAHSLLEALGKGIAVLVGNIDDSEQTNQVLAVVFSAIRLDVEQVKTIRAGCAQASTSSTFIPGGANGQAH